MKISSDFYGMGIADENFERGKVPMTKCEVRVLSLSKLRLQNGSRVIDIGAGTGSISIEAALIASAGKVYSVEVNKEAVELIKNNAEKFGALNMDIVQGYAPEAMSEITGIDRVFIGGSKGRMDKIFDWMEKGTLPGTIVVANAITIESASSIIKLFEERGYEDMDISLVQVSKGRRVSGLTMMSANNPIYIISAKRRG
ncbi:cobalt-precorrin-6B (C15)-methyltransferase [Peptoclostridium litorale DSM 5388]|uniref:Putative cobalt-precorrin-6Y C(15)-methyltransferase n=1 Tax=Peptoclostridium litorale DSM 5388 TaxID=1121324 RepID=A0A069RK55_PEPLI|nr:precorrin-6Y C5,15-methyltransferase (decarboxylating) subunit CbiT [Peptoclostridium litorale]KDR96515.1 putative cobalt-precorrin-6Y C(15)-methyltransferase [Peptoclostridium litorale DSM 5388]SIN69689.1 cobalt-precorrin-6B (C15)-methyltransferase [Peptoclostridium litorale DSM 5388]